MPAWAPGESARVTVNYRNLAPKSHRKKDSAGASSGAAGQHQKTQAPTRTKPDDDEDVAEPPPRLKRIEGGHRPTQCPFIT
eukprot:9363368-Pyramimonas_sp.AAC.1